MKFGISTRALWDLLHEWGFNKTMEFVARCGYDFVEIWAEYPWMLQVYPIKFWERWKEKLKSLGLDITVHATKWDLNFASLNPMVRRYSLRCIKSSIKLAKILNARVVVIHPGRKVTPSQSKEDVWRLMVDGLDEILRFAKILDVEITVENMEPKYPRETELVVTRDDVKKLLENDGFHKKGLKLTLDIAHVNLQRDGSSSIEEIARFVKECKDYLGHVHISNNYGPKGARPHLPLYEGNIDIARVLSLLKEIGYNGYVTVEGYLPGAENSKESAEGNIEYLREILKSENL